VKWMPVFCGTTLLSLSCLGIFLATDTCTQHAPGRWRAPNSDAGPQRSRRASIGSFPRVTVSADMPAKIFQATLTRDREKVILVTEPHSAFPACSLRDLITVATEAQARSSPSPGGPRQDGGASGIPIRKWLETLAQAAMRYAPAVDVVVQSQPSAAIVWGCIRFLIGVSMKRSHPPLPSPLRSPLSRASTPLLNPKAPYAPYAPLPLHHSRSCI
jgi:hypothetical protein